MPRMRSVFRSEPHNFVLKVTRAEFVTGAYYGDSGDVQELEKWVKVADSASSDSTRRTD